MFRAALLACALPCLLAQAPVHAQAQPTALEGIVARQIDAVAKFNPPEFTLGKGKDGPFAFYGGAMNEFEKVTCERQASFRIIARANEAGAILAGVCEREAPRARSLAAAAQPRLAGMLTLLRDSGLKFDATALDRMGWRYEKSSTPDGAEEHYFPVIAVGHGFASLQTVVRVPAGRRRAILVQAEVMRLCEKGYGLQDSTALCKDTRRALADIARRLETALR